jgi:signal transduction histidine kinase
MGALSLPTFLDLTGQKVAQDELRDAVEARDEFFSVATHELKDPLFSLQLSIQLLRHTAERQGPVPAHVRQHLEVSERQVTRLGHLVDNMLDIARIVNGRFELDLESLDLCELAHQVVARFQAQASSSGTPLLAEPCAPVVGRFDRLRLEQVVGNLLSNAIKYGAGKPVTVRVRGEDRWAIVEVEDRGAGIAPEDQGRIFERFERLRRPQAREPGPGALYRPLAGRGARGHRPAPEPARPGIDLHGDDPVGASPRRVRIPRPS